MYYTILDFKAVTKHSYYGARSEDTLSCQDTGQEVTRWETAANDFMSRYIEPLDTYRNLLVAMDMGIDYRKAFFPEYKARRKKEKEKQSALERDQMELFSGWAKRFLTSMGATLIGVQGVEADDVIAWLCEAQGMYATVHTVDADLIQLVSPTVGVSLRGEHYHNGDFYKGVPTQFTSLMKSMVGDPSDGYKGVHGFGVKAFESLSKDVGWEGMAELQQVIDTQNRVDLEEAVASRPDSRPLRTLLDHWGEWVDQWRLAKLHPELCWKPRGKALVRPLFHKRVPDAGKLKATLEQAGALDMWESRLRLWVPQMQLVGATDWDALLPQIKSEMLAGDIVAFDYETTDYKRIKRFREAVSEDFVDVLSQSITGVSFCFGEQLDNLIYIPVDHADSDNVGLGQLKGLLEWLAGTKELTLVAQNFSFEGTVTHINLGLDLSGVWDTKIMQRYADENASASLKDMSASYLGYTQATYKETLGDKKRMADLTQDEVLKYGTDDALVTAHLSDLLQLKLRLEHQWDHYLQWCIYPAQALKQAFVSGSRINWPLQKRLAENDHKAKTVGMEELRQVLTQHTKDAVTQGCESYIRAESKYMKKRFQRKDAESAGSEYVKWASKLRQQCHYVPYQVEEVMPRFSFTSKQLSDAALAVGLPEIEKTSQAALFQYMKDRGLTKDNADMYEGDQNVFLNALSEAIKERVWDLKEKETLMRRKAFDHLAEVCQRLAGVKPKIIATGDELNVGSPEQMKALIYCKIGVPVRLFGSQLSQGRQALGITQSAPATDEKAILMALANDVDRGSWQEKALKLLLGIKEANTRTNLFHKKMPLWIHEDGKVHPYITDSGTDTRRPTGSNPNILQMPGHGAGSFMRAMYMPPGPDWVCVGIDFSGQELRIVASESQDPVMLEAYNPDNPRDIHSTTGVGIVHKLMRSDKSLSEINTFERFNAARKDKNDPMFLAADEIRAKAKACIAEGSLVLTDKGEIPIEDVTLEHKVWDGSEFVSHEGVVSKGVRDVMTYGGLTATPDHVVYLHDGTKEEFGEASKKQAELERVDVDSPGVSTVQQDHDEVVVASNCPGEDTCTQGEVTRRSTVYDIVNAGPRHRFTVSGVLVSNCNFLMTYLGTPPTLARNLLIPVNEAEGLLEGAFDLYKGVLPWQERVSQFMLKNGYTRTAYGTRRHAKDALFSNDKGQVKRMLRQGVNATVQGCASESLKTIMTKLHTEGWLYRLRMQYFAGIYDEVVSWVHKDDALEYCRVMQRLMTEATPPGHAVPQVPEFSIGYCWGVMDELGSDPSDDDILKLVQGSVEAGKGVWETDMQVSWEQVYGAAACGGS